MRFVLFTLSIIVATTMLNTPTKAQNYPWCAQYGATFGGATNCGFTLSTMPSYLEWDGRLLRAEYTLRASTRAASVDEDKALSVLSPNQLRLPQ